MEELKKIKRVMVREIPGSPHEVLLVIDATTGQNAVNQAKMFNEEIGVSGIVLTKMDGTSKGGIVFRIASELHIPIRYIGIGETVEDLRPFKSDDFINALFDQRDADHEEMNSNKQEM
jgi:fused signal recognition particle receptor